MLDESLFLGSFLVAALLFKFLIDVVEAGAGLLKRGDSPKF